MIHSAPITDYNNNKPSQVEHPLTSLAATMRSETSAQSTHETARTSETG